MDGNVKALVIEEFISGDEQDELRDTAVKYRRNGILEPNPGGPKRFRKKIFGTPYCDRLMQSVGERIVTTFGIRGCPVDPYLGWIISFIEPGGFIKLHIDAHQHYQETPDRHLRCNVLVQGRGESACPIVDEIPVRVGERGLWAFFASEYPHGTQLIQGVEPRIVYQYGFTVPGGYTLPGPGSLP